MMKFKNIDGVEHVILEENEKICVTSSNSLMDGVIEVESSREGLNIFMNSSIVNKISGEGILEKVYILPVLSAEDVILECDQWLRMFKRVHDIFKSFVLKDKHRKHSVVMNLDFGAVYSFSNGEVKRRTISLNLTQFGNVIQEGVKVSIDVKNESVYLYLVANVLSYYLLKNYDDSQIELLNWNRILLSNDGYSVAPIISNLNLLCKSRECRMLVESLIGNHNIGLSSEQLIDNLKGKILNQQLDESFENDMNFSTTQYEFIVITLSKGEKLIRTKK